MGRRNSLEVIWAVQSCSCPLHQHVTHSILQLNRPSSQVIFGEGRFPLAPCWLIPPFFPLCACVPLSFPRSQSLVHIPDAYPLDPYPIGTEIMTGPGPAKVLTDRGPTKVLGPECPSCIGHLIVHLLGIRKLDGDYWLRSTASAGSSILGETASGWSSPQPSRFAPQRVLYSWWWGKEPDTGAGNRDATLRSAPAAGPGRTNEGIPRDEQAEVPNPEL